MKDWKDLTISDDYMFKLIIKRKRICKQMLERILHIEIEDLSYVGTEKVLIPIYGSKGVRMDVYVKDGKGTVYNIEMQVRKPEGDGLAKRTRYYQAMMDADLLAAGADYDRLNPTIIIFICSFDPFDAGRYIYTFENQCLEDNHIQLKDGTRKIFLNTKGETGEIDASIKAFLRYVDGAVTTDHFVQEIDREIHAIKSTAEEEASYMSYAISLAEERKEGIKEGIKEGEVRGKAKERLAILRRLVFMSGMPVDEALSMIGVPADEWEHYRQELKEIK